jgi:hypothetical protein
MAEMTAACDDGDTVACDSLSREDEAKKAWLERQDVPTWGAAATTLAANAADAAEMAEMSAACEEGDQVACDSLSREEDAKREWLARQDVPTWVAPAAVSPVASEVSAASTRSGGDIAKQAWLAKQDTPSWGKRVATAPVAAPAAALMSDEVAKTARLAKLQALQQNVVAIEQERTVVEARVQALEREVQRASEEASSILAEHRVRRAPCSPKRNQTSRVL